MSLINHFLSKSIMSCLKSYNHTKYWKRRTIVVDKDNKTPILIKLYYILKGLMQKTTVLLEQI